MPEVTGQLGEMKTVGVNVRDLIVDRLGIDFNHPPKEISGSLINRIIHFRMTKELRGDMGIYFPEKNAFIYNPNLSPKDKFETRIHEGMHGLFKEVNPDYFETIKTLLDSSTNPTIGIAFGNALIRGQIDEEKYLRAMSHIGRFEDVLIAFNIVTEGIAEWGRLEMRADHVITTREHLNDIEEEMRISAEDKKMDPYFRGNRFVTSAIDYLERKGIPRGEALLRLMSNPPLIVADISVGGAQYAIENLI